MTDAARSRAACAQDHARAAGARSCATASTASRSREPTNPRRARAAAPRRAAYPARRAQLRAWAAWPSSVSVGRPPPHVELAQVSKVANATNALAASTTCSWVMDFDIEVDRVHAEAHLVGQAEAEPGFPLDHRQHNVEFRVEPQRQSLQKRQYRLLVTYRRR